MTVGTNAFSKHISTVYEYTSFFLCPQQHVCLNKYKHCPHSDHFDKFRSFSVRKPLFIDFQVSHVNLFTGFTD